MSDEILGKCPNCGRPLTLEEVQEATCQDCGYVIDPWEAGVAGEPHGDVEGAP